MDATFTFESIALPNGCTSLNVEPAVQAALACTRGHTPIYGTRFLVIDGEESTPVKSAVALRRILQTCQVGTKCRVYRNVDKAAVLALS